MSPQERLQALYLSQPENQEQADRKIKLVKELELHLGITKLDESLLVVNGDLSDLQGFTKT